MRKEYVMEGVDIHLENMERIILKYRPIKVIDSQFYIKGLRLPILKRDISDMEAVQSNYQISSEPFHPLISPYLTEAVITSCVLNQKYRHLLDTNPILDRDSDIVVETYGYSCGKLDDIIYGFLGEMYDEKVNLEHRLNAVTDDDKEDYVDGLHKLLDDIQLDVSDISEIAMDIMNMVYACNIPDDRLVTVDAKTEHFILKVGESLPYLRMKEANKI